MRQGRRVVLALACAAMALAGPGCLVVGLNPFYDDAALTMDERLLGQWRDADDNVSVVVERGEWRSYRLQYTHPTDSRALTGYLFKSGDATYLDLAPLRGQDPGPFLLPGHALVRIVIRANEIDVATLDYDWFTQAIALKTLPAALAGIAAERGQVALGAERATLRDWVSGRGPAGPMFGETATFSRQER